jgi:hypothetical protein
MIAIPDKTTLWILKLCAAGLVLVLGYSWAYGNGKEAAENAHAVATAKAERLARAAEDGWRGAVYDLVYKAETRRIQRERQTAARESCLLDGSCRMRDRFSCPRLPKAPGATGPSDDGTQGGLLAADGAFLVRLASECDAVVEERNLARDYIKAVIDAK